MVLLGLVGFIMIFIHKKSKVDGVAEAPTGYVQCLVAVVSYAFYQIFYLLLIPDPGKSTSNYVSFLTLFCGVRGVWAILLSISGTSAYIGAGFELNFAGFPTTNELIVMAGSCLTVDIYLFALTIAIIKFSPVWVSMV